MKLASSIARGAKRGLHGDAQRGARMPSLRRLAIQTAIACASIASTSAVHAQSSDATDAPEADLKIQAQPTNQWTGLWTRQNLLGDIGGVRPWLHQYGISFGLQG